MSFIRGPRLLILMMLVSFPAVSAVLFTPALPQISEYFRVSYASAEAAMSIFLVGYSLGQLLYAPLANRYGRKKTIYIGLFLSLLGTFGCWLAPHIGWLFLGRFFQALGAAVGLKITFTMIGDTHTGSQSVKVLAYIMLAFAIAPGLAVALGGLLTDDFGWKSCFFFLTFYTILLGLVCLFLPETAERLDKEALCVKTIRKRYGQQFFNRSLMLHATLFGLGSSVIYLFATSAPYIGIEKMHLSPSLYGLLNMIPLFGFALGQLFSSSIADTVSPKRAMLLGIWLMGAGAFIMFLAFSLKFLIPFTLFVPQAILTIGISLLGTNASSQGLSLSTDKAHAAAVVQFMNMGLAAIGTYIASSWLPHVPLTLPSIYLGVVCLALFCWAKLYKK